jgi:mRNA-degrading endonuclease RelE of RelBE toxin-antitoxin system
MYHTTFCVWGNKMKTSVYIPPRVLKELKKLKKTENVSTNNWILQAIVEKINRDIGIDIDLTDRRKKGKLYRMK